MAGYTYKIGENGVEGKCALCGTYVIKGGVKFRAKSVLCGDCAQKQERIGDPYRATRRRAIGRRSAPPHERHREAERRACRVP